MNSQNQKYIAHKSDPISNTDLNEDISRLEALRTDKSNINDDDLIAFLQNRRENRRARQVVEWETTRREMPSQNYLRGAA